jgi:hypothetical protein
MDAIVEGLEMQSDEIHAYLHRPTGRVIFVTDDALLAAEDGDDDALESGELEDARAVLLDDGQYVELPDRFEVNEYRMLERLARSRTDEGERAASHRQSTVAAESLPCVTHARHVHGHVVWLRFADGVEGEVDVADGLTGALLAPLRDVELFARVQVQHGTLVWPNGADWAPETLRERVLATKGPDRREYGARNPPERPHLGSMPEISRFFGIIIRMLANDHASPHFHTVYGDYEIAVTIRDAVVTGRFPGRALRMVLEWREPHERESLENWSRLREGQPPREVPPLA